MKTTIRMHTTARQVEQTRKELFESLSDPVLVPRKVAAYTAAVKRHRELIFADLLRNGHDTLARF